MMVLRSLQVEAFTRTRAILDLPLMLNICDKYSEVKIMPATIMCKLSISPLPQDLQIFLNSLGLNKPNMCFHNCFLAVMNNLGKEKFKLTYVLAWVTHKQEKIRTQHALIKFNNMYFDPTLEPQNMLNDCDYELEREFDTSELIQLMISKFELPEIKKMIGGEKPWWPLAKTESGYDFLDNSIA